MTRSLTIAAALILLSTALYAQTPADKARHAVDLLLQEKYSDLVALFSPEMQKGLPEDKLRSGVQPVLKSVGAVRKQMEPRIQNAPGGQVVTLPIEFERATLDFVVSFNSEGQIAGLWMRPGAAPAAAYQPPAYTKAGSFRPEDVIIGKGEWQLPGTLALPAGKGPFAALVLVHGSGPNDRDESMGPNKPFRDLAEGLASRGIAVLRYEKRTRHYPGKVSAAKLTVQDETIDDALAAAEFLRGRPEIDHRRVFLLGHSLGGYLLPRIGHQDPKLAGLISLAGSTRRFEDLYLEQLTYLAGLSGSISPEAQEQLDQIKASVERVKTLKPGDQVPPAELPLRIPVAYWLDLQKYDPPAEARTLKQPMLILQGERDYQVTMVDFARWKEALKDRRNVTYRSFPALNHAFFAGEGKCTPAEYNKVGHVAPEVIDTIAEWITKLQ